MTQAAAPSREVIPQLVDAIRMLTRAEMMDHSGHGSARRDQNSFYINSGASVRGALTERDIVVVEPLTPDRHESGFLSVAFGPAGTPPRLEEVELAYFLRVLDLCEGHRTAAAQAAGVSYPTFLKRLRDSGHDENR